MKLVFLGAPGVGKGTQSKIVAEKLNLPTISTGEILRAAVKNKTAIGLHAQPYLEAGELVPDDVVFGIIRERVAEPDCEHGYILDGMPRTIAQAEALEENGIEVEVALSIEMADDEIVERMAGRRICNNCGAIHHLKHAPPKVDGVCDSCGGEITLRQDDEPETVKFRLDVYHRETEPLKGFYESRGKLKKVDNRHGIEAATAAVFEALGI